MDGGDLETANESGGADRDRTGDLMLAKHALSQLSYSPMLAASFERPAVSPIALSQEAKS